MNPALNIQVTGLMTLKQQIEILGLPTKLRRRLMARVGKKVISDSKRRVRTQTDLSGQSYPARAKKKRGGSKMLLKLARQLKVIRADGIEAVVGFYKRSSARIAAKQQHGYTQRVTARSLKRNGTKNQDSPATRDQARALREAGFTINKRKSKNGKKPSLKWVTQNLTIGQAGSLLRQLREQAGESPKTSWKTTLPARSFLGATKAEITQHFDAIFKQIKQEIARGVT